MADRTNLGSIRAHFDKLTNCYDIGTRLFLQDKERRERLQQINGRTRCEADHVMPRLQTSPSPRRYSNNDSIYGIIVFSLRRKHSAFHRLRSFLGDEDSVSPRNAIDYWLRRASGRLVPNPSTLLVVSGARFWLNIHQHHELPASSNKICLKCGGLCTCCSP